MGGKSAMAHKQEGKGYAEKKLPLVHWAWRHQQARIIVGVVVDPAMDSISAGWYLVFSEVVRQTPADDGRRARHLRQAPRSWLQNAGRGGFDMELIRLTGVDEAVAWLRAARATEMVTDSRKLQEHSAFVAWPGYATGGRKHDGTPRSTRARLALWWKTRAWTPSGSRTRAWLRVYGLKSAGASLRPPLWRAHPHPEG